MQLPLPAGCNVFPWDDLPEAERLTLVARHEQQPGGWYPPGLTPHPFNPATMDHATSLGLRRAGQVVGWILTHVVKAGMLDYDVLFVSPELQRRGYGIRLLAEAIKRQYAHHGQEGAWGVVPDNAPMLRFVERRIGPWLTDRGEERHAEKVLVSS